MLLQFEISSQFVDLWVGSLEQRLGRKDRLLPLMRLQRQLLLVRGDVHLGRRRDQGRVTRAGGRFGQDGCLLLQRRHVNRRQLVLQDDLLVVQSLEGRVNVHVRVVDRRSRRRPQLHQGANPSYLSRCKMEAA